MGNQYSVPGPNDVVILQYGNGFNCDCGPARFEASQAAADQRLLARGVRSDEVTAKIQELNVVVGKFRNPFCYIFPPLIAGMIVMVAIQISPFIGRRGGERDRMLSGFECPRGSFLTSEQDRLIWPTIAGDKRVCGKAAEYHAEYCDEASNKDCFDHLVNACCESNNRGSDNQCEWKRVCELHEAKDPVGNRCCAFYCCAEPNHRETKRWDMKGPHQISPEEANSEDHLEHCPMMHPHDRIFDLSGARSDLSRATAAERAALRAEPWFNETLTLVNYVGGTMDLGCQCNVLYDSEKWSPSCEKMLVAGDFRSKRKETHHDDGGPSFLDILRYMGGLIVFLFVAPGIYCLCIQRSKKIRIVKDFFADWVQRGIVQRVSYFPGSKHMQARVTLHLPPMNTNVMLVSNSNGHPGIQMAVVQQPLAPVIEPPRGGASDNMRGTIVMQGAAQPQIATGVVVSSSVPMLVPSQQSASGNQIAPMPVPTIK